MTGFSLGYGTADHKGTKILFYVQFYTPQFLCILFRKVHGYGKHIE